MGELTYFDFLDDVSIESNDESGFVVWPVEDNHRFDDNLQSIDKAMLPTNSFSGSDLDLTTPHDSSDEEDEVGITDGTCFNYFTADLLIQLH